ncbi:MAG: TIGR01777 family protein [candidate division Zixibacteria bacterium]|nr:TIGR01777 family protein [candidate division Zixibacteria bacterium]
MLAVIAGGTGFIGRGLSRKLLGDGYDVAVLTRNPDAREKVAGRRIRYVKWDGSTAAGWGALANGAAAVVNLAGANLADKRWTPDVKERILRSRLAAGNAVAEAIAAAKSKPGVLVQASAVGVYGSRGDEELDESSPPGDGFLAEVVRKWEYSTAAVEEAGVRRVVIRSALVLGRDGGAFPRLLRPFKFFVGGPLGTGRQWFPWVHYRDEIEAIKFLIENARATGVYNLCGPQPLRNCEFSRIMGQILKRPWWWPVPAPLLRTLYGEMADALLLASEKVLPRRMLEAGFQFNYRTAEAALRDLVAPR